MSYEYNYINDDLLPFEQPQGLITELFLHQKRSIAKLSEIEQSHTIKFEDYEISTNIGIFADNVGGGKTLSICSLIRYMKNPTYIPIEFIFSSTNVSIKQHLIPTKPVSNLIIVPFSIYSWWVSILKMVKMYFIGINRKNEFDQIDFDNLPTVVLITDTMYKALYESFPNITWNRLIIDEPQQFKSYGYVQFPKASFNWIICATPEDILRHVGIKWLNHKLLPYNNFREKLVILNRKEFIDLSNNLPNIEEFQIMCKEPIMFNVLRNLSLPREALNRLHANDFKGALEVLNINAINEDNIVDSLIVSYKDKLTNAESEIQRLSKIKSISETDRIIKIQKQNDIITSLNTRIDSITTRVNDAGEICSICLDVVEKPRAITKCCQHSFCLECMVASQSFNYRQACPSCNLNNVDYIVEQCDAFAFEEKKEEEKTDDIFDKNKTLMKILNNLDSDAKILIFSEYYDSFNRIKEMMLKENMKFGELKGQINSTINKFKNGDINILLLNASKFGAGLNLQMTTDLIIYHKFSTKEMKTQVIGRAQRVGRDKPLRVHNLLYKSEL